MKSNKVKTRSHSILSLAKKIFSAKALIGIILLAGILRITGNTVVPPSPYWEEVALGYDAYSILKTGADHQGNFLPVVAFPSFGDFKPSGYFYALVPSIALFGLNTWAVRLPAVVASTLTTWVVYAWARELTKKSIYSQRIALLSALLWAVQPWSWWLGRLGFEVVLATFLLSSGTFLFWKGLQTLEKSTNSKIYASFFSWMIPATLLLAASMYTYHGTRLLAPLFTFWIAIWQWWQWPQKTRWSVSTVAYLASIATFAVLLVSPILVNSRSPVVQQRIAETSLFSDTGPVETSNMLRESAGNTLLSRIFFHRSILWTHELLQNYMSHFSPAFLFFVGDENPRHSTQFFGMLYPFEILTVLASIWVVHVYANNKKWLLLGLLLLSPVAAMFTQTTPHALRALPMSVWLAILSGFGFSELWRILTTRPLLPERFFHSSFAKAAVGGLLFSGVVVFSTLYAFEAWSTYNRTSSQFWQYGYEEMISKMRLHQQENERLFVSRSYGRPSMYVLFYEQVDPRVVQKESKTAEKDQRELLQFQEWSFFIGQKHESGLHAAPPDLLPEAASVVDTVEDPTGKTIWSLYR